MIHKSRKREEISCFEVLDVLFRGLEASAVEERHLWRLGISKLQFVTKKI
jgi:hypothetical protein